MSEEPENLSMPSESKSLLVEIEFTEGIVWMIGAIGPITGMAIEDIEKELTDRQEDSVLDQGDGRYLLSASYFEGQYGEFHRCELPPGWEFSLEKFIPAPTEEEICPSE